MLRKKKTNPGLPRMKNPPPPPPLSSSEELLLSNSQLFEKLQDAERRNEILSKTFAALHSEIQELSSSLKISEAKCAALEQIQRQRFIDVLQKELEAAGIRIKRGAMVDWKFKEGTNEKVDDNCEWLTIILKSQNKMKKYEVEFFFDRNSTHLHSIGLYRKKKKKGYGSGKLIGLDKNELAKMAPNDSYPNC